MPPIAKKTVINEICIRMNQLAESQSNEWYTAIRWATDRIRKEYKCPARTNLNIAKIKAVLDQSTTTSNASSEEQNQHGKPPSKRTKAPSKFNKK